jgi:hypothetical protein
MHETYIKLMCRFHPKQVLPYLVSHEDYPLDSCLQICKEAGVVGATCYLLERTGDLAGALTLLLQARYFLSIATFKISHDLSIFQKVYECMENLKISYQLLPELSVTEDNFPSLPEEKHTMESINLCIELCNRNAQKLDDKEIQVNRNTTSSILVS